MTEIAENPKPFSDTAKDIARRFFRHENAVLTGVLVAIIAVLAVMSNGVSLCRANVKNILVQSSIRGIASMGQLFVILTAGIDLSVGGLALLSMFLGASLMTGKAGLTGLGVGAMIALLAGVGIGVLNGLSVSRIGMPALIVTLAMWQILKGCAYQVTRGTPIWELPPGLASIGQGSIAGVPVLVSIFVAAAVATYFVLNYTTFGRSVYAVGGNPVSAWLSGINVKNMLLSVYMISGFLAGLAGYLTTARLMSAHITGIRGLELDTIAAVVVGGVSLFGGRGTVIGVVIGVMIIGVINNGMNVLGVPPSFQDIVKGVVIFTAVAIDFIRRR